MTTKKIAAISLFTALAVITNLFSFNVKHFMVSFNYIPCFIAGAFSLWRALSWALWGLLGGLIRPLGPYIPLIGIASGCSALFRDGVQIP